MIPDMMSFARRNHVAGTGSARIKIVWYEV